MASCSVELANGQQKHAPHGCFESCLEASLLSPLCRPPTTAPLTMAMSLLQLAASATLDSSGVRSISIVPCESTCTPRQPSWAALDTVPGWLCHHPVHETCPRASSILYSPWPVTGSFSEVIYLDSWCPPTAGDITEALRVIH